MKFAKLYRFFLYTLFYSQLYPAENLETINHTTSQAMHKITHNTTQTTTNMTLKLQALEILACDLEAQAKPHAALYLRNRIIQAQHTLNTIKDYENLITLLMLINQQEQFFAELQFYHYDITDYTIHEQTGTLQEALAPKT